MQAIIIAFITAGFPALVTIITSLANRKLSKMHSAKQSILQMIMEDYITVEMFQKPPRNYMNIHYEYDIYHKNGGNSDIDTKMTEYEDWYSSLKLKGVIQKQTGGSYV
jgi:archaellum component FlaG (FlaF/FlaG flagellin family)